MKNLYTFIILICITALWVSCISPEKKSLNRLLSLEQAVSKDTSKNPDKKKILTSQ